MELRKLRKQQAGILGDFFYMDVQIARNYDSSGREKMVSLVLGFQ